MTPDTSAVGVIDITESLVTWEGCNNVDFAKDTGQGDKAITVHILIVVAIANV